MYYNRINESRQRLTLSEKNMTLTLEEQYKITGQDMEKYPDTAGWNPDETFEVGQIFKIAYSPYAAKLCNDTQQYLIEEIEPDEDGLRQFKLVKKPDPTAEEIAEAELAKAKAERAQAVNEITVEVDGMVFDADEISQSRVSRAVTVAVANGYDLETTTTTWVLADNTIAQPTIKQLSQVLELAGRKQTELWTIPYES